MRTLARAAEDLSDLRAFDKAVADLASGEGELILAEFANRLIAGESPVRVWREYRGMNQTELGRASGVNWVVIADIEAGRKGGSVSALKALAAALGVTIDDLA